MMMGKILTAVLLAALLVPAGLAAPEYGEHAVVATVDHSQRYWGCGISYTRVIELQHSGEDNGTLIATYECATSGLHAEKPGYNIHVSRDGGSTWEWVTTVREKATNIQSEWMPFLYELPCRVGDMPAGTLLLAACSVDSAHSEYSTLRIYRSYDVGQTWEQYSTICFGNGALGVWEPFLMVLPDGRLACYYSDCTESETHSQKMVMRISEDGVTWGRTRDIVALEDQTQRPGMGTVVRMNDGRFIMTYEMCNAENPDCGNPVYYRFSEDGIDWGDPADPGFRVVTDTGAVPGSSPYLAYVPGYGENGLLLMTSAFQTPAQSKGNVIYVNDQLGDPDAWRVWFLPKNYRNQVGGYSHATFAAADGQTAYFVNNIPDTTTDQGYAKMIFVRYRFTDGELDP